MKVSPVVPDTAKKSKCFPQPVCVVVFPYDHVVAAARYHKDDRCDVCRETANQHGSSNSSFVLQILNYVM